MTFTDSLDFHEVYNPATDTWETKAPLPIKRSGGVAFAIKGRIYVAGGMDYATNTYYSTVECYDVSSDKWLPRKSPMPIAAAYMDAAVYNNIAHVISGMNASGNSAGINWTYDPSQDGQAWTTKANIPTPRSEASAAEVGGKIYVYGGVTTVHVKLLDCYDPVTDTWSAKAAGAYNQSQATMHAVNGKLCVIGGWDGTNVRAYTREYNPATNTWAAKANHPYAHYAAQGAVINGKIYIYGGMTATAKLNYTHEYDPSTDTWMAKAANRLRNQGVGVAVGGKLYVIGGDLDSAFTRDIDVYDPIANSWATLSNRLPADRADLAAAAVNGLIYLFGGLAGSGNPNNVYVFDPATGIVGEKPAAMPSPRFDHVAVALNDVIFLVAGYDSAAQTSVARTDMYDPRFDPWTTRAKMTTARYDAGAVEVNGKIYVIGGFFNDELATNEMYDPATDTWTTKQAITSPTANMALGAINGKIYMAGGRNSAGTTITTRREYDPATNGWVSKTAMPATRESAPHAVVNGLLYVLSGYSSGTTAGNGFVYNPSLNSWSTIATGANTIPTPVSVASAAVGSAIYVFGGHNGSNHTSAVQCYDTVTDTWSIKTNMPEAKQATAALAIGRKVIVVGGSTPTLSKAVHEYDVDTNMWKQLPDMPVATRAMAYVTFNGKGYIFGGYTGSVTSAVYEIAPNDSPTVRITSPVGTPSAPGGNASTTSVAVTWDFHDPEGLPQAYRQIEVFDDQNVRISYVPKSASASTSAIIGATLAIGAMYSVVVTVWDVTGLSATSDRQYFVVTEKPTATNPTPAGTVEAPGGGSMTPRLQLDYFDPEGGPISKSQWVLIDTTGATVYDSGVVVSPDSFYDVPSEANLQAGQVYGWKGRVADNHGVWSEFTEVQYFITNNMPGALTPVSPVDTYRTGPSPVFVATIGDDVEDDGQKFVLQIADDQGFTVGLREFSSAEAPVGWEAKTMAGDWAPITGDGVTSEYEGGQVRYTMQSELTERKEPYFWRMAPIDASSGARGPWSEVRGIRSINRLDFDRVAVLTGDALAERILINLIATITTDGITPAELKVFVTNNALDVSSVWEDATQAVLHGEYHRFQNTTKTAAEGAVMVWPTVQANDSLGMIEVLDIAFSFD